MGEQIGRRRFLVTATAAGAAVMAGPGFGEQASAAGSAPGGALAAGVSGGWADWFARPGAVVRPKVRWWWPDGLVDPAEIRCEVDQLAAAGFGGAEIAAVHHSIEDKSVLDPVGHGWGSAAWVVGVEAALDQAERQGLTIDLTIGPSWPAAVPTITPDHEAAVKELQYGVVQVVAGGSYSGPPPEPVNASDAVPKLLKVAAWRLNPAYSSSDAVGFDIDSYVEVAVTDGSVSWTSPADGTWLLFAFWERGSGQQPESGPHTSPESYVVDHFSAAGARAVIDYWERQLLTPTTRRLLRKSGGALFEDSIELETSGLNWTPALPEEFARRRGYDVWPYLPAIVRNDEAEVFQSEAVVTRHVRHDYWLTVSDLFAERHFSALTKWAHSLGLEFRCQPYGLETDSISAAAIVDIPEGESLGFRNLDDYRALAGGRDLGGRKVLSCEAGAYQGGAYGTTWKKLLLTLGGAYAAGLNQTVLHGFSYASAPGAEWPRFAAFTPYDGRQGYSESWGPRQPTWRHVPAVTGYLGRIHQVLQTGTSRIDVAAFRQKGYTKTGIGVGWFTASGVPVGWTHQMVSAPLLDLDRAVVRDGRLAPDGPSYKVLFVEGDRFAGNEATLPVETARKLLSFARAELAVVFLGSGWSAATVPGVGESAVLREVLAELFAEPRVRVVAELTQVPVALAELGVSPDVSHPTSTLLNHHRVEHGDDYYYLVNGKHAESVKPPVATIDHDVTFTRSQRNAVPFRLDPWTGAVAQIGEYVEDGDRVTIRITLKPGEATIIAFRPGRRGERPAAPQRASDAGAALAPIPLESWQLDVESYLPGPTPTETIIHRHRVSLDALAPWSAIPGLEDVSGVGRYTTAVDLDTTTARLDLGEVFDTAQVTVNGHRLPPVNLLNPVVDLTGHLRRGRNTIQVEVATTLLNRLRVTQPTVYSGPRQNYGLLGPVHLIPR
ncbi:glycosyl hydrolase [Kribbella sp. NPDC049174]|uniref:glycosyl hydrolase n=1 Tax=Kribbella sp. NPDC049174 TaxID=3364112 RepID=UPI00372268A2